MGRKKIALISASNANAFIDYISKKLDHDTTDKFVKLIDEAKNTRHKLELEFSHEYDVDMFDIIDNETLNENHTQMLVEISDRSFKAVNDLIESTKGLKTAFRNATAQKLYKLKNKHTEDSRVLIQMSYTERHRLLKIRDLCRENDLDFDDQLSHFHYQLKKQIEAKT